MFRATLQDVSLIRDSLDAISALITEASFKVDKDGIHLTAMDPASVAMVDLIILPSAFFDFSCSEDQVISLRLANLVEILKRAKMNDQITFESTENKLKVTMKGDFKRSFSIPLFDTAPGSQNVPNLEFASEIEITSNALRDGIKDAAMISDCVILDAKSDLFSIKSFGDISETNMTLVKDSASLVKLETSSESKAKYSIDYLDKMLKATKIADTIKIRFKTDYPMRMDCTVIDKLRLSFIVAPRVDTD